MPKRLEDRIKDLGAKAVETPASPQLDEIFRQLQSVSNTISDGVLA